MEPIDAETVSSSPLPIKKQKTLTFAEAIIEANEGKKITKLEWGDKGIYGFFSEDERLKINLKDKLSDWIITQGDLRGDDWIVLEEVN